jgi:hypothetical protein
LTNASSKAARDIRRSMIAAGALSVAPRLLTEGVWAITPGFGVRYETPVGPLRVDLGFRPARTEVLPVITEFIDEDGIRRLVRLETPYEYDPIEAAGGEGFLQQVLARLRLHLSIGEAL